MTEQDLLNALSAQYPAVTEPATIISETDSGITLLQTYCLVTQGDSALGQNINYYVINRGQDTEQAFFMGSVNFDPTQFPGF